MRGGRKWGITGERKRYWEKGGKRGVKEGNRRGKKEDEGRKKDEVTAGRTAERVRKEIEAKYVKE